jgi:hypothetical protein
MFVAEPRKPRAQRLAEEEGDAALRDRRKSERRLSKGVQIAWSGCQIIDSKELKLINAVGAGAYGKVGVSKYWQGSVIVRVILNSEYFSWVGWYSHTLCRIRVVGKRLAATNQVSEPI